MPRIHVTRAHRLGREDAKAKVELLARSLRDKLGADYRWEGDRLRFERAGASGFIDVRRQGVVEVEVTLGLVLAPMKERIQKSIDEGFDRVLSGPDDATPA